MSNLILKPNPTLGDLQQYVKEMVVERGFVDDVPRRFMLLLEEAGEFSKAARKHAGNIKFADDTQTKELNHEAADVLIILLGLCNLLDIDLEKALRDKEEINKQRTWR